MPYVTLSSIWSHYRSILHADDNMTVTVDVFGRVGHFHYELYVKLFTDSQADDTP